ncbi:MAG: TMEM14 family protein [Mastigocoleus sp.]
MTIGVTAALVYGIMSIVGGIIGYKSAGSKVSLISGGISGLLLIISAIIASYGSYWGLIIAVIITAALVLLFAFRFSKTRKIMPAGLMSAAGTLALILMIYEFLPL